MRIFSHPNSKKLTGFFQKSKLKFKSLVLSHFDFFSTLCTFIKQPIFLKPEKYFYKSLKHALGLRASHLNLEEQFQFLKPFGILPLHMLLFRHYFLFIYNLFNIFLLNLMLVLTCLFSGFLNFHAKLIMITH